MNKLWDKHNDWSLNKTIEAFETGEDLVLDQKLVKYDCWGTMAHAKGLYKIGILSEEDIKVLSAGLKEILNKERQGKFELKP
ncbi:MAG: argininosuccinate lyase, partial [Candidatus Levybacteria bacterium]|nr:argininosuccinate lyase [Candidatus Levybacteria bacterium]